jgi:S-adenosylmethionine/arginine decarboxylase-like enzyme
MTVVHSEFGPHLMLDCRGCNYEKISNLEYVFKFLNELPERIGMTKITQPYVFPYCGIAYHLSLVHGKRLFLL